MLLHEEQQEAEHTNSNGRVTPQELAEAVAALEARKEAERSRQAETISISDALNHLGLDTPEEEILSEVETLRKQRALKAQQAQIARTTRRVFGGMFAALTVLVIATLGIMNLSLRHALKNATLPTSTLPMQTLSQVPEGRIAHCDSITLVKLAGGLVLADEVSVDTRPFTSDVAAEQQFLNEWAVTRSNGQILVTAWASADQALAAKNNQPASVFSNRPQWLPASNVVPVQLPVYRFVDSNQVDFLANGAVSKEGSGVVQALSVSPTNSAFETLVKQNIDTAEHARHKDGQPDDAYFTHVAMQADGLHLIEDSVGESAYKQRATQIAQEALQRVNVHIPVINDMKLYKPTSP